MNNPKEFQQLKEDFPGLLYDKLWENVIQKENRLWTFLSVYGAAVGIVIATKSSDSPLRIEASLIILFLTYWAAELILDSDWWSVRNRMMIERLELRAGAENAGLIPKKYREPRYRSESLTRVCLFVFALIGLVTFWMAVSQVYMDRHLTPYGRASWICALYATALFAALRCEHVRESQIMNYYDICRDLQEQDEGTAERRSQNELRDRHARTGRTQTLFIALALNAILFLRFTDAIIATGCWLGIANSVLLLAYWSSSISYYSYNSELKGQDAGFLLIDRDRRTGRVTFGPHRAYKEWLTWNWIFVSLLVVSLVCLWLVMGSGAIGS